MHLNVNSKFLKIHPEINVASCNRVQKGITKHTKYELKQGSTFCSNAITRQVMKNIAIITIKSKISNNVYYVQVFFAGLQSKCTG